MHAWYKECEGYKVGKYPDGQIYVKIDPPCFEDDMLTFRIASYEDLFILISLVDAIRSYYGQDKKLNLYIPCLFGQQSDRRFNLTESFDLKSICDIINGLNFSRVFIFDPHSDVCMGLINNSMKVSPDDNIEKVINLFESHVLDNVCFVSSDAGAYKKCFALAEKFNRELIPANKHRDRDGNIIQKVDGDVKGKHLLIVDDICIGGASFKGLAKNLIGLGAASVSLYVSHFQGGKDHKATFESLLDSGIEFVFTTDSYENVESLAGGLLVDSCKF